jgi:hypothetical protein
MMTAVIKPESRQKKIVYSKAVVNPGSLKFCLHDLIFQLPLLHVPLTQSILNNFTAKSYNR